MKLPKIIGGFPKVVGVSRVSDNDKVILVSLERPLTDDELRNFHEELKLTEHQSLYVEIVDPDFDGILQ